LEPNKRPASLLKLTIILFLVSIGCIGSIVIAADLQCRADIEAWVPLYPNGETASVEYDFVRPRAMGTTRWIQTSTDDIETIKQFYRDLVVNNMNAGVTRGLASTDWRVEPDEDDQSVNRIVLFSSCGI